MHLLPVMLRNDLPSERALWIAVPLLAGGLLIASGLGRETMHRAIADQRGAAVTRWTSSSTIGWWLGAKCWF